MNRRTDGAEIFDGSAQPNERGNAEAEKDRLIKAFMIEFRIRG